MRNQNTILEWIMLALLLILFADNFYKKLPFYHPQPKPKYSLILDGAYKEERRSSKITYHFCLKTNDTVISLPFELYSDKDTMKILQTIKLN